MTRIDPKTGVEWLENGDLDDGPQCARCGSSVARTGVHGVGDVGPLHCLSSAEWCVAHPLPGRESMKGAGR